MWPSLVDRYVHGGNTTQIGISGVPRKFFGVGVQKIHLRTEGRENVNLGVVAPYSGVPLNLKTCKTRILSRLLRM
jgi:hypothetical protein